MIWPLRHESHKTGVKSDQMGSYCNRRASEAYLIKIEVPSDARIAKYRNMTSSGETGFNIVRLASPK